MIDTCAFFEYTTDVSRGKMVTIHCKNLLASCLFLLEYSFLFLLAVSGSYDFTASGVLASELEPSSPGKRYDWLSNHERDYYLLNGDYHLRRKSRSTLEGETSHEKETWIEEGSRDAGGKWAPRRKRKFERSVVPESIGRETRSVQEKKKTDKDGNEESKPGQGGLDDVEEDENLSPRVTSFKLLPKEVVREIVRQRDQEDEKKKDTEDTELGSSKDSKEDSKTEEDKDGKKETKEDEGKVEETQEDKNEDEAKETEEHKNEDEAKETEEDKDENETEKTEKDKDEESKTEEDEKETEESKTEEDEKETEESKTEEDEDETEESKTEEDEDETEESKTEEDEDETEESKMEEDEDESEESKTEEDEDETEESKTEEDEDETEESKTEEDEDETEESKTEEDEDETEESKTEEDEDETEESKTEEDEDETEESKTEEDEDETEESVTEEDEDGDEDDDDTEKVEKTNEEENGKGEEKEEAEVTTEQQDVIDNGSEVEDEEEEKKEEEDDKGEKNKEDADLKESEEKDQVEELSSTMELIKTISNLFSPMRNGYTDDRFYPWRALTSNRYTKQVSEKEGSRSKHITETKSKLSVFFGGNPNVEKTVKKEEDPTNPPEIDNLEITQIDQPIESVEPVEAEKNSPDLPKIENLEVEQSESMETSTSEPIQQTVQEGTSRPCNPVQVIATERSDPMQEDVKHELIIEPVAKDSETSWKSNVLGLDTIYRILDPTGLLATGILNFRDRLIIDWY